MKKFVGFHEDHEIPLKKGDIVTIRKGTKIRTTMPRPEDRFRIAKRTYKVRVDHVLNGMNRPVGHPGHQPSYPVNSPAVRWPGSGGYWFEADVNDIPEAQGPASV